MSKIGYGSCLVPPLKFNEKQPKIHFVFKDREFLTAQGKTEEVIQLVSIFRDLSIKMYDPAGFPGNQYGRLWTRIG